MWGVEVVRERWSFGDDGGLVDIRGWISILIAFVALGMVSGPADEPCLPMFLWISSRCRYTFTTTTRYPSFVNDAHLKFLDQNFAFCLRNVL